ncbi:glycosyltransferase family 4 protein [Ramlibacter sp. PS3R-8]|uniref:glycosyltransferase family 4 protein n=1 Tax=Ramlibacter sp. PS3R-8 TaxID=3133437 RepID=UPI0030AB07B8
MKIVLATSEFPPVHGGIGAYALAIASAAAKAGHRVILVAPDYGTAQHPEDANYSFEIRRFGGGRHSAAAAALKLMLMWRVWMEHRDADIVHAVDWPFYIPLALSPFRNRAKCFATFHGTEVNFMRRRPRRLALDISGFWRTWLTPVTNSRYTTALLTKSFPESARLDLRTVPLGVVTPPRIENQTLARAELGMEGCDLIVLTVGRVVPRKGHHHLARALSSLDPSLAKRITWLICGPADDPHYVEQVRQASVGSYVQARWMGAVPRRVIDAAFTAADLFCLAAQPGFKGEVEGFGLVYLEAASFGLPSVGTDLGGVSDALIPGVTGQLVPANDELKLASTIEQLLLDPDARASLSRSARLYAAEQTWAKVVENTYGFAG